MTSLLASGVSPREMYDEVTSRTRAPFGVTAAPLFRLGPVEFLKRSLRAPAVLDRAALATALSRRGAQPLRPRLVALRATAPRPPRHLRHPGVPGPLLRLRGTHRPLRRLEPRALRGGGGPGRRRGGGLRRGGPPRRARLQGGAGLGRATRASTVRCASTAATTWTAGSRRPPTSTSPSATGPTSSSASTPSCRSSTTPRRGPLKGHLSNRGRDLRPRPGAAHHAPRAHGLRPGALPGRAPRGGHPAPRAHPATTCGCSATTS